MQRIATAVWKGGPRAGTGTISTASGTLNKVPYSLSFLADDHPCTNPTELLAAAHASCISLTLSQEITDLGYTPQTIETDSVITTVHDETGWHATHAFLDIRVRVPDLDEKPLREITEQVLRDCPVSRVFRPTMQIEMRLEVLPPSKMEVASAS